MSLIGQSASPAWIPLFFLVIILLFIAGSIIAHALVKLKISHVFEEVADCQHANDSTLSNYEHKINELINNQNRADMLKRNLDEMQEKYDEFMKHNRQVEIWEQFYAGINEKISAIMDVLDNQDNGAHLTIHNVSIGSFDEFPALPTEIVEKFQRQEVAVVNNTTISDVTCFVQNLRLILIY